MSQSRIFIFSSVLFFIFFLLLVFTTTDGYGGADSFQHYMISRYSWKYPHLFLDHWGKPVFTLLSSPFSQVGYKGALLFNVVITLLSSLFVYRIAVKLNNENSALSALFFLAMPMVILVSVSALTEPLFALVLVLSVWLFSEKKYFGAIALLSFLPLVRTEGFVVFPVFIIALLLQKQWKYIPLFAVGGLVYSLAGYFVLNDFLWLINRSPYKMESSVYGSGPWYHFIMNYEQIFGIPLTLLLLIGLWYYVPKNINWLKDENNTLRILIAGSFAAYFAAHSYVWWKGTGGSLGLERVITGVCPLAAIIAFEGYCFIAERIKKYFSPNWILLLFFIAIVKNTSGKVLVDLKQQATSYLMGETAEWIKSKPKLINQRLFYYNPHIAFLLDKDVFDRNQVEQLWALIDEKDPLLWLEDGQYLVWDSHFGNNEGQTPLDKLLHKQNVKILKRFYPEEQGEQVLGGYTYEIFVFGKQSGWKDSIIEIIPDSNSTIGLLKSKNFSVSNEQMYVEVFENNFADLSNSELVYLDLEIKYPAEKILNKDELIFVLEMNCNQHSLKYDAADISYAQEENGEKILRKRYMLPPLTNKCEKIKTYFWNRAKTDLQNIKVEVKVFHVPQNP
jgi:hypothetical protein